MKFGLTSYVIASLFAQACIIYYAYYTQKQFYPAVLFLVTSKVSVVLAGNLCLAMTLVVAKIVQFIFFGTLRTIEMELLMEKAKYAFIETCLALTVFRQELTGPIIALFGFLIFIKLLHKLAKMRQEYLEQIADVSLYMQIRMGCLLCFLVIVDGIVVMYAMQNFLSKGRSVLMLFGFEFGLLVNYALNLQFKFILQCVDTRMENGLPSRGFLVMIVDLMCDVVKVVTYVVFFGLIFSYYGLPIHLVRDVYAAYHSFHRKLVGFIKYLQLTRNLENRFPDASEQECTAAGNCLVCRDDMTRGKKLPCGHVFHLDCLRMWLQHQQSCPLCRADIVVPADGAAPAAVGAAQPQPAVIPAPALGQNVPINNNNDAFNIVVPNNADNVANPIVAPVPNGVNPIQRPINMNNDNAGDAVPVSPVRNNNSLTASTGGPSSVTPTLGADILRKVAPIESPQSSKSKGSHKAGTPSYGQMNSIRSSRQSKEEKFPAYYVVACTGPLSVYASPTANTNQESNIVRQLTQGSIVFVSGRLRSPVSTVFEVVSWLRIADGWVIEQFNDGVKLVTNLEPLLSQASSTLEHDIVSADEDMDEYGEFMSQVPKKLQKRQSRVSPMRRSLQRLPESTEDQELEFHINTKIQDGSASREEILVLQEQLLTMSRNMEKMHLSLLTCQQSLSQLVRNKIKSEAQENYKLLNVPSITTNNTDSTTGRIKMEPSEESNGFGDVKAELLVKEEVVAQEV